MKLVWKVKDVPTGTYRSFDRRGWPNAYYETKDGQPAVQLLCEDEYRPDNVKSGNHKEITVCVAFYHPKSDSRGAFTWRKVKRKAKTLKEAKEIAQTVINSHPEIYKHKEEWK